MNAIDTVGQIDETCFRIEYDIARKLAMERRNLHVEAKNGTERWNSDQYKADTTGVAGELAFAKFSGLEVDLGLYVDGDKGTDFKFIHNSKECVIDVKSFEQRVPGAKHNFKLYVAAHEIKRPTNVYVLAKVAFPNVWLLGWETKFTILNSPTVQLNYLNYTIPQNLLRPMDALLRGIQKSKNENHLLHTV